LRDVRHRPQRPVRGPWVATEHDEQIGPVDVGHRDGQRVTEDQPAADVLGELVHRGRRVHVAGPQRLDERADVELSRERVGVRVAEVDRHAVGAVLVDDRAQPGLDLRERLVPRGRLQRAVTTDAGGGEPVRIVLELTDRGALGTEVALAEHVLVVAADRDDPVVLELDQQAARGLAERAGPHRGSPGHIVLPRRLRPGP
jgi:hypothetical protein